MCANNIKLQVKQSFPIQLNIIKQSQGRQPIRAGIPFAPGQCLTLDDLSLWQTEQPLPHQLSISSRWPDGSIRWLMVDAMIDSDTPLQLRQGAKRVKDDSTATLNPQWQLAVQQQQVQLTQPHLEPLRLRCTLQQQTPLTAQFAEAELIRQGTLITEYRVKGHFSGLPLQVELYISCYPDGLVQLKTVLHNPQRAKHSGGLWDLGDAGSVNFNGLTLDIRWQKGEESILLDHNAAENPELPILLQPWQLQQLGSGGSNWQSDNHLAADGTCSVRAAGYLLQQGDTEQQGLRATPQLQRHTAQGHLYLTPCEFWQNFPSSLSSDGSLIQLGLFAPGQPYELQGGERKTQQCWLQLQTNNPMPADTTPAKTTMLSWPLRPAQIQLPVEFYQQALAMPWLSQSAITDYDALIQPALDAERGFMAKREVIDEYGWRNFGDIFADHESLYLPAGSQPYISHYNNQYDPGYGFCRQYLRSGDPRWWQLMDELARHVSDIDIYHTDQDKAEYNRGLFWHTDHYLPAHTCTHRTYSKHNTTSSIPGQTGGGPANEHCYSTGLLYHYWLTGNGHSKEAVLGLAQWMINVHEGAPGFLSKLWSVKLHDIPKLQARLRGAKALPYRYPFTRGTGNYLNTLLDAYELTTDIFYLKQTERVLHHCIHPNDDIAARNLLDIENCWSYLVLLGVLPRYLRLKTIIAQQDENFHLMRAAFYQYSCWLAEHEDLFLLKAAQLEFPNDTWAAQDMRKVILLHQAAQFFPQRAAFFLAPAQRWQQWLQQRLQQSAELEFARVQVLLLLLQGPQQQDDTAWLALPALPHCDQPAPQLTFRGVCWRIGTKLLRGLLEFRPGRERHWLRSRMNR